MIIEKPWEEFACPKCVYCFEGDMCRAYKYYTSYCYCPQIRGCEKFKEKYEKQKDN